MARIPLAEIPNAPTGGKPALANPQFPSFEVGNQAVSQIREGYQSNMVDERAAGAMGRAMQNVGQDLTQIGLEGMDAVVSMSKMAEKEATGQFLANYTEVQGEMKTKMAGASPSMYPVIVKDTYRDKNGNLNPRLFAGISQWGMKYATADALRSEAKDMAEYSLQAHIANLEQDEGRKLAAMQTLMTSGKFADAEAMNDSLFSTRRISPDQYASNKVSISANRDNQTLMSAIQENPEVMAKQLTTAMMSGKPIEDIKNISLESYPRYIKAAEYATTLQTAEKLTTLTDLIDGKSLLSLDALRANPIFKTLDQEKQTALTRRLTNSSAGTPASEMAIKQTYNKLLSFPKTDKPWEEYATLATEATSILVDPYFEPFMKKLNERIGEMAENGGVLAPSSKIEKYVADKIDLFASMGMFGQVPEKQSGMEQSPEYVQQMLAIETAKMEKMQLFRSAGIKTQSEADEFLNSRMLPAEAKNAWKAEPNIFQKAWRSMFPSAPAKPDGSPVPTKGASPQVTPTPTGNEVSMFDPDVTDLTGGAYAFKVTDKTRDALPSSTPMARQVSLDFNDAASPTARGVEIIIPNDATEQERAIAKAYVDRTTEWFRSKGIDVPNRGVRTAKENGRGTRGRFHTEPFFVADSDALAAVQSDPDGYAKILASTLGRIDGMTFIAPHKTNDPGASRGGINERDFARQVLIPALQKLAT